MYSISAFHDKEPAQPTCAVYPPSSVRYRDIFSVKTVNLPPQGTSRSYSARPSVVLSTPQDGFQHKPSGHLQWLPQKLLVEGTCMSTVQRAKLPGQGTPTFPSKLPRASPTSYPVFLDTSSYLQRYCQKSSHARTVKTSASSRPAYDMGTLTQYEVTTMLVIKEEFLV